LNNRSITNKKSRNKQKTGQADRIIRPVLSAFERADLRDARSLKHLYFKNFAGIIKTPSADKSISMFPFHTSDFRDGSFCIVFGLFGILVRRR
jgi:hypothetical protein